MVQDEGQHRCDHPALVSAIEELRARFQEFRENRRYGRITVRVPFQDGCPGDPDSKAVTRRKLKR